MWLAGARGIVHAEGTQHAPTVERGANDVPTEGAGTLGLTADMKAMRPRFVRGVSLVGYGVSLALGVGIPIPVLNERVLAHATVRDRDILAPVVDYSADYPNRTGKVLAHVSYEQLKSGEIDGAGAEGRGRLAMSSYAMALEVANLLADEIRRGEFLLSPPSRPLPREGSFKPLVVRKR